MRWSVVSVEPLPRMTLAVRFEDGTEGRVRFQSNYLEGVFQPLQNPEIFDQVRIEFGAVTWPGEIDLAPDAMYEEIKRNGEWVLG